jgi:hypothetical protein
MIERALHDHLERALIEQVNWKRPRDRRAFEAFDELTKKGCDRFFLVAMLSIIAEAPRLDTWEGLTGFSNPKALGTALKRLWVCANDVEKLLGAVIGKAFLQKPSEQGLATQLRSFAHRVEKKLTKPNRNVTGRAARGSIVRHVEEKTGGPHDRLVADILYPALGCNESAQNQWRQDNASVIAAVPRR